MTLHDTISSLPTPSPEERGYTFGTPITAYQVGYKDALHAAAEVAVAADSRVERLTIALEWITATLEDTAEGKSVRNLDEVLTHCNNLLEVKPK